MRYSINMAGFFLSEWVIFIISEVEIVQIVVFFVVTFFYRLCTISCLLGFESSNELRLYLQVYDREGDF